ncbi:MAG: O-antigen ligase family protein [Desulfobacter sp.]|nr:MAG: O-antigen ligase family protein [Desulfobacter sp.]
MISELKRLRKIELEIEKERIVLFLIMGGLFFNPFPHNNFLVQLFFYSAVGITIVLAKEGGVQLYVKSPLFYPLLFFSAWSAVSVLFALDKPDSIRALYSHLIRYLLLYLVLVNFILSQRKLILLSVCIVVSEFIFTLWLLIYFYLMLGHGIHTRLCQGFSAIAIDIVPFGMIMGIILAGWLFQISRKMWYRILLVAAILVLLSGVLLTHSKGAFLSLCVALPILFWKNKKTLFVIAVAVVCITLQTPLKDRIKPSKLFEDHARMALIFFSLEIIEDHPIVGTGFSLDTYRDPDLIGRDKYLFRIPEQYQTNEHFLWPHNMLLNIGVRTGVTGILFFCGIFAFSISTCIRLILYGKNEFIRSHAVCCIALILMFFVNGLVQPVFVHFLDTVFYTILAMITIIWKINENIEIYPPEGDMYPI